MTEDHTFTVTLVNGGRHDEETLSWILQDALDMTDAWNLLDDENIKIINVKATP